MIRLLSIAIAAIFISIFANPLVAQDCLKEGDPVGAFYVTKIAGAISDGVQVGQELCYRCRYGSRPMIMVFARKSDAQLVRLVKEIDTAIGDNNESQLRGLVTFLGEDVAAVKDAANDFAKESDAQHVPVAIAKETKTGPPNYKLDDSAVTILLAEDSQLISIHRSEPKRLDVPRLMGNVRQLLQSRRAKRKASSQYSR